MPQAGCDLSPETRQLAAEFQRLRSAAGQFQGGSWNDDLDAWMGHKHQVMIELGERFGGGDCGRAQLTDLLGSPDLVSRPGDAVFNQVQRQPEFRTPPSAAFELLIYYWRGAHDYLYFVADGQTIFSSGWWHAYE